jgi:adenine deaminase
LLMGARYVNVMTGRVREGEVKWDGGNVWWDWLELCKLYFLQRIY